MAWVTKSLAVQAVVAFGAMHFAHRFGYITLVVVAFFVFGALVSRAEKAAK